MIKIYFVPVCASNGIPSTQHFDTLEEADAEARWLSNLSGKCWIVRQIEYQDDGQ